MVLKVLYIDYSPNRVWPKFDKKTTILYYNLITKLHFPRKQKLVNNYYSSKSRGCVGGIDCEENIIPIFYLVKQVSLNTMLDGNYNLFSPRLV